MFLKIFPFLCRIIKGYYHFLNFEISGFGKDLLVGLNNFRDKNKNYLKVQILAIQGVFVTILYVYRFSLIRGRKQFFVPTGTPLEIITVEK